MFSDIENDSRNYWLELNDPEFMKLCKFDEYQSSGPGGQKRNRKYSAVRLTHIPTGIEVTSAESRSQKQNKKSALFKLRKSIAVEVRGAKSPSLETCDISQKNRRYPLFLAKLFDELYLCEFRISDVAEKMGVSTGKLVRLISKDSSVWQKINSERKRLGLNPLKK